MIVSEFCICISFRLAQADSHTVSCVMTSLSVHRTPYGLLRNQSWSPPCYSDEQRRIVIILPLAAPMYYLATIYLYHE